MTILCIGNCLLNVDCWNKASSKNNFDIIFHNFPQLYPQPLRLYFWTESFKYLCQVFFFMAKMRLVVIPILFTPIHARWAYSQNFTGSGVGVFTLPIFRDKAHPPKVYWGKQKLGIFFSFEILPTLEKYSSMFSFFSSWKCPSNFAIFPSFFNSVFW